MPMKKMGKDETLGEDLGTGLSVEATGPLGMRLGTTELSPAEPAHKQTQGYKPTLKPRGGKKRSLPSTGIVRPHSQEGQEIPPF